MLTFDTKLDETIMAMQEQPDEELLLKNLYRVAAQAIRSAQRAGRQVYPGHGSNI